MSREFDVIIWGASGFTGRLVAEYVVRQYGTKGDLRWAMAGRNETKLQQVATAIGAADVPRVLADSHDLDALKTLATRTKVVCTTVGPYALYGSKLVEACIAEGTDYCDLTGEVQWMRRMIDLHQEVARKKQVRIVHTCGFDSIPSDMGVYWFQEQLKAATGQYAQAIHFRLKAGKGGFSGGTIASLNNVLAEAGKDPSIFEILGDPYGLNPEGERHGPDGPDLDHATFDPISRAYMAPFVMASINTRVVRRSQALQGRTYGADFRYNEATLTGKGFGGKMAANVMSFGMNFLQSATPGGMKAKFLGLFLPNPGEGPSQKAREAGFYVVDFYAEMPDGSIRKARVKGDRDPGYGSTSKMLAEAAICLAQDKLPARYGHLTPSVAMGDALLNRLQDNAGLSFEMRE
ncbi:MAG: saccharopine dehydrogenase NADP-binding domain-containing protein [Bacteroidota bacterium]